MQPTALNKIVSLFLVGGLMVLGVAYLSLKHAKIEDLPTEAQTLLEAGGEGFFAVVGGLLLLPLAALAGALSESLTDIIIRPFVAWISKKPIGVGLLFQTKLCESHDFWKTRFEEAVKSSSYLAGFPVGKNTHGVAVALLYGSGQEESINWAESHYSTYVLVSNFASFAVLVQIYLLISGFKGWYEWPPILWGMLVTIAIFYLCLSISVDRYLYSYQVALRQAAICLLKEGAQHA